MDGEDYCPEVPFLEMSVRAIVRMAGLCVAVFTMNSGAEPSF